MEGGHVLLVNGSVFFGMNIKQADFESGTTFAFCTMVCFHRKPKRQDLVVVGVESHCN